MALEIAFLKRAKISQAQQYMMLAVLGAGLVLGVAVSLIMNFTSQIAFNANAMAEEDKSIVAYSNAIKNIGICKKPAGEVYSEKELKDCNPDSVTTSQVSGSLRSEILNNLAANEALNSVPKEDTTACLNAKTQKDYTYQELQDNYNDAVESGKAEDLKKASELIQNCSALRVVPDALPAFKNEEALLASLNKIFLVAGMEPESLSPTGESGTAENGTNLRTISVRFSVEAGVADAKEFLDNMEKSIREFNVERASFEWASGDTVTLQAQATAYYMTPTTLSESTKTLTPGGDSK